MSVKAQGNKIEEDRRSNKSRMGSEANLQKDARFDEAKIIDHYIKLKAFHQQKLANINMSQQLKRKLFGFSQTYYLTNMHDPYKLIVENHPLKGRTVTSEQRFKYELHNKERERQFKSNFSMNSQSQLCFDSDLDVPFPEEKGNSKESNIEIQKLQSIRQEHH